MPSHIGSLRRDARVRRAVTRVTNTPPEWRGSDGGPAWCSHTAAASEAACKQWTHGQAVGSGLLPALVKHAGQTMPVNHAYAAVTWNWLEVPTYSVILPRKDFHAP